MSAVVGPSCHTPGIKGYGNPDRGIMFIGISPARDEMKTGRPFTGQSGKMLDACLKAVGIQRNETYATNLMCWWKDEPNTEEFMKCNDRLEQEIRETAPKLIVLFGTLVTEHFTGRKFGKVRGAVQWNEKYNCYVMGTYHPAAIIRGIGEKGVGKDDRASGMIYDFIRDLKKINDVVEWQPGAPEAQVDYKVVDNYLEAQQVLDELARKYADTQEPIAIDVETDYDKDDEEVDVETNNLLCLGVGTSDFAWVFTPKALYHEDGTPALTWTDLWWTMWNGIFDVQVIRLKLGVWLYVHEDAMLQNYSLDERAGIHRLKANAREYLAASFYEEDRFHGKVKMKDLPSDVLYEYNARDVVYTARLSKKYRPWQEADDVRAIYERILIPSVNMYKEVQFRGCRIDTELHAELGQAWITRWFASEDELQDMAEQEGFSGRINLSSPAQLSHFLYVLLSLPVLKLTKGGKPSTDEETLEKLKNQHPFVEKLIAHRHLDHMIGLYIKGLYYQLKQDGRAHAITKLHGSRTGRPSYTKPPLQTIPTPYEYKDDFGLLRRLFIASDIDWVREFNQRYGLPMPPDEDEEMVIIEADFGKAEIWMAYTESGDPQLLADLTSGDYHSNVSADIFNKPIEEVGKDDRLIAKRTTFGIMYGVEAKSLGELIKRTTQQAGVFINRWLSRNKVYHEWTKSLEKIIRTNGELVTKTGRKRRLIILGSPVRVLKQAYNFPIQATANDILQEAALEVHPKMKEIGGHLLFTVHDSILSEVPRSKVPEATKILHDALTRKRYPDVIQIPVEISVGYNWGQTSEVHDCANPAHKQKDNDYNVEKFGMCLWESPKVD